MGRSLALVPGMRILWIFVCLVALSACKSEPAEAAPAPKPVTPDPSAPADVAAPPKEAKLGYGEIGSNAETGSYQPLGDLVFDVELIRIRRELHQIR